MTLRTSSYMTANTGVESAAEIYIYFLITEETAHGMLRDKRLNVEKSQ